MLSALWAGFLGAAAQSIDIRGMARDASGNPLPGAVVTLMGRGLRDTTDQSGLFRITNAMAAKSQHRPPLQKLVFSPERGFALRMLAKEEISAEIKNGAGRVVVHGSYDLEPGDWALRPRNLPKGLYTVQLRTGTQLRALRLPISDGERGEGPPAWVLEKLPPADTILFMARRTVPGTVDSLKVEKPEYFTEMVPVESWSQSDLSVQPRKRDGASP